MEELYSKLYTNTWYNHNNTMGSINILILNIIIIDIKRYMDTRHQEEKGDSDIISYIYIYPFIRHACTIKST